MRAIFGKPRRVSAQRAGDRATSRSWRLGAWLRGLLLATELETEPIGPSAHRYQREFHVKQRRKLNPSANNAAFGLLFPGLTEWRNPAQTGCTGAIAPDVPGAGDSPSLIRLALARPSP